MQINVALLVIKELVAKFLSPLTHESVTLEQIYKPFFISILETELYLLGWPVSPFHRSSPNNIFRICLYKHLANMQNSKRIKLHVLLRISDPHSVSYFMV